MNGTSTGCTRRLRDDVDRARCRCRNRRDEDGAGIVVAILDQEGRHQRVLDLRQHDGEGLLVFLAGDLTRQAADERVARNLFEDGALERVLARSPGPVRTAIPQAKQAAMRSNIATTSRNGSVSGNPCVMGETNATIPPSALRSRRTLR